MNHNTGAASAGQGEFPNSRARLNRDVLIADPTSILDNMDGALFEEMMGLVMGEPDARAVLKSMTVGLIPGRYARFFQEVAPLPPLNDPKIVSAVGESPGCSAALQGVDVTDIKRVWDDTDEPTNTDVHDEIVRRTAHIFGGPAPVPVIGIDYGSTDENYGAPYMVPHDDIWTEQMPAIVNGKLIRGAVPAVRLSLRGTAGYLAIAGGTLGVWDPDPGVAAAGVRGMWGGDWGLSHPPGVLCEFVASGTAVLPVDWGDVDRRLMITHEGSWNDPPGYDLLVIHSWERSSTVG